MNTLFILLIRVIDFALVVFQYLMLIRAVLSWLPGMNSNAFAYFVDSVTEPVISPVRSVLSRFESLRTLPIDMSFLVTYILLIIVRGFLPNV